MSEDQTELTPEQGELLGLWLAEEVPGAEAATGRHVPPRHRVEAVLADIWAEALGVPHVGVTDDYFALGGDSVLAIVVVARAAEAGIDITARDLFDHRTIAGLELAEEGAAEGTGPAWDAGRDAQSADYTSPFAAGDVEDLPLTPLQEGILYHSLASGRQRDGYLVQAHCLVIGAVDLSLMRAAWETVLAQQPALRAAFRLSGPHGPRRWIAQTAVLPWTEADWRDRDRRTALVTHLRQDRAEGFDLEQPPLSRVAVFREADDRYRIVWTHHHLVLDGWSQQIVLRGVLEHYADLVAGTPRRADAPLTPHTEPLTAPVSVLDEETHWRAMLAGARPTLLAPDGDSARESREHGRAVADDVWSTALVTALEEFAVRTGVTRATVIAACWGLIAAARTRADEALFGLTVSGRDPALPGATDRVGMFVNTLLTRVTDEGATTGEWLRALQDRLTESRGFAGTALSRVLRLSGHERLFDSLLVVENFPTWLAPGTRIAGLVVDEIDAVVDEGYPLVVEVASHRGLTVRLRYDTGRVPAAWAEDLLGDLRTCAEQLVAGALPTPAALRTALEDRLAGARERAARARRAMAEDLLGAARRRPAEHDVREDRA